MAKKICIISHLHLSANPRVWKEANALAKNGYEVTILTTWTLLEKLKQDYTFIYHPNIEYKCALNLIKEQASFFTRNYYRAKKKILEILKLKFGYEHSNQIVGSIKKYINVALKENADLYIGHLEGGLMVANELLKHNKKVAFDFEDWYSKDFINAKRPIKLLEKLEKNILKNACYVLAPSVSMAKSLNSYYNTNRKIEIVYNGFSVEENKTILPKQISQKPRFVWFSQTVGKGRGLETLVDSLHHVATPVHVKLIGNCVKGYDQELKKNFPFHKNHSIEFIQPVHHNELLNLIANNEIGLALEEGKPASRDVTITNKILQYLQANLLVLATKTQGQQEVFDKLNAAVAMVSVNDAKDWSNKMEQLITQINSNNNQAQQAFYSYFSWEIQAQKILSLIHQTI